MNDDMTTMRAYYDREVVELMEIKFGIEPMDGLRRYLSSEAYRMFADESLRMWDFSPAGIFDMWVAEQVTGEPRDSLYIRRD